MEEKHEIIKLILAKREYYQRFSDEHYIEQVERFKKYFPNKTADEERKKSEEGYDNYLELIIPLGCSRIGGPVVDLPDDIDYPDGYTFMAQINCSDIKSFDKDGLLPENGFLYFFVKDYNNDGIVYYSDKDISLLKRVIKEHEKEYFSGKLIIDYRKDTETISSRYTMENGIKEWDYFAGDMMSKIYGIYSNCQAGEEEIFEFMNDKNRLILLQIGEDYMGEGCQSVIINKNDLMKRDFSKCIFEYNQS
jgi:uncharacterized protein YwqG